MTLLKKLLPIASVASVAAVVAPIATSCGTGNVIDGTKIIVPTIAPAQADAAHAETPYDEDDALDLYLKDLKENSEIFQQDWAYSMSCLMFSAREESIEDDRTFNAKIKYNFEDITPDVDKKTLSYKFTGSMNIEGSTLFHLSSNKTVDAFGIYLSDISFEVSKLPYEAASGYPGFRIRPNQDEMLTSDFSIVVKVNGYISHEDGYFDYDNYSLTIDKNNITKISQELDVLGGMLYNYCGDLLTSISHSYHLSLLPTESH